MAVSTFRPAATSSDILRPARRRADWGYPLFVVGLSHLPDRPARWLLPADCCPLTASPA